MPNLQVTCTPNVDFDASTGDLPSVHVVVGDGTNEVEQDVDGNTMAGYLSDTSAFTANVVRPAFKQCRMATLLADSFVALQSVVLDEGTIETEVIAAKLAKIPE